jgi:hypothetical protein
MSLAFESAISLAQRFRQKEFSSRELGSRRPMADAPGGFQPPAGWEH